MLYWQKQNSKWANSLFIATHHKIMNITCSADFIEIYYIG